MKHRVARISPEAMRQSRPARNPDVEEIESDGLVTLRGPAVLRGILGRMIARAASRPIMKHYELEEIGCFVWSLIDGRRSFESISKQLQSRYKMNRLEADASLAAYLRMLSDRGLITLLVKESR